jgi:hypothetical protein
MQLDIDKFYVVYDYKSATTFMASVVDHHSLYEQCYTNKEKLKNNEVPAVAFRLCSNGKVSSSLDLNKYLELGLTQVNINEVEPPTWSGYAVSCIDDTIKPKVEFKENKKMNIKLLDIYYEKESKKLHEKYESKADKLRMQDLRYSTLKSIEAVVKTNMLEEAVSVYPNSIKLNDDIEQEIRKAYNELNKKETELCKLCNEINAQLEMCETYEQKQEILKRYKVINEKGTIN